MTSLQDQLAAMPTARLQGMRRGLEKESLRVLPGGELALTPHPQGLGSPLTHPTVTTDFSESQIELVTGTHGSVQACLTELQDIHRAVFHVLGRTGEERLWPSSMPCRLPTDETIPLGRYGSSNVGRAKSIYRMGLAHRYGRRMQTISGIHYNWSLPGVNNEQYFALIRNFRRHAFLLLVLFGASPLVCKSFVAGREHQLREMGPGCMGMPHATSLRMGRLGYQSDAQSTLNVSYNSLEGYAASLEKALTEPYPAYEAIGIRNPGGDYNQLDTSLLQIENEFYGTIRPKRVIRSGERPLHALRERGVEYVEVRLMDLNPFEPAGISADTMRFLDVFLLHCLLSPSAPDSLAEIDAMKANQHLVASRGREPGLMLTRTEGCGTCQQIELTAWAAQLLDEMAPVAARLDAHALAQGEPALHAQAVAQARASLANMDTLPSARVLQAVQDRDDRSFVGFVDGRAAATAELFRSQPLTADEVGRFMGLAQQSFADQKAIEAADTMGFEAYRQQYVSPAGLVV
ncbi:glutamate--cysteine ligase [Comamonas serinivorans]|uniref:Glutamate--cysteine ligase n=1 Tax=Comamonas serinivorans TaxID=1082851 RepID=A0A1Y0ELX5_9BURK|nr:glutamate--cysteine ligase [Comamonas serinivorans]ARU04292.1 glutamate--cysteine ligase [Comamonas serinivorans]